MLDRGWEIGFHPAAVVWHHRRPGVRRYLRQQRGYGRSEALVEARHPSRFTLGGTARWRGRIYASGAPALARQRVYRGEYGAAAYQSVYRADSRGLDLLHQAGLPAAAVVAVLPRRWPLIAPELGIPALAALVFIGVLAGVDALPRRRRRAAGRRRRCAFEARSRRCTCSSRSFGVGAGGSAGPVAATSRAPRLALDPTVAFRDGRILVVPHSGPRPELVAAVAAHIRRSGVPSIASTGWDAFDVRVIGSTIVGGELTTSVYPEGYVQVRIRRRPRAWGDDRS